MEVSYSSISVARSPKDAVDGVGRNRSQAKDEKLDIFGSMRPKSSVLAWNVFCHQESELIVLGATDSL
jgi:hypothetical protein